jgi:hypothetical protein
MKRSTLVKKDSPQSHKDTKIETTKQPFTPIRHCEERFEFQKLKNHIAEAFAINKRRSNLPSPTDTKEVFTASSKITSPRIHSREIASWMQQRLAQLVFIALSTETRNDERCKRRKVRRLHKNMGMTCIGLWAV